MRQRAIRSALGAALALGSLLAGCHRGGRLGPYRDAPVILISIDTLRADHLPPWGYNKVATPAIDSLARDGIVFENAYSQVPLTLPSHTTMMSGLLPSHHGVRDNVGYSFDGKAHPDLPEILSASGYATAGFVSTFVLRPDTGISSGFQTYDCDIHWEKGAPLDSAQRPGAVTEKLAEAWLRQHTQKPFFLFLHLYDPHTPWNPAEPFKSRYPDSPYDAEIATADAAVGAFLDDLRTLGLYDHALILLVGDHGEGLGDHGEGHHGVMLYRSTLHVPMIVKLPGRARAGTRQADPVGLLDVAPTVVALTGVANQAKFDGRSLFAAPDPAREIYAETYYPRLHYGWSDLEAAYDAKWSLIDGPTPELFDLTTDPAQLHNVLLDHRRELARLRAVVARDNRPLAAPQSVDAETAAKLASLGYISGPALNSSETKLPDPRSQRSLLHPIEQAIEAVSAEKWGDAEKNLRAVLAQNPKMYDMWMLLRHALNKQGKDEEAVAAAKQALELSGGSTDLAVTIAEEQVQLKHYDDARKLAETVRSALPKEAGDLLFQIAVAEGEESKADRIVEEARRADRLTERMADRLALGHLEHGEPAAALDLLSPFVKDGGAPTLVAYGLAQSDSGDNAGALRTLQQAQALDDKLPKLHEALGIVLLRLQRAPEARAELEHALKLDDHLVDAWNTLGVALYQLEGAHAAIDAWKHTIALDPNQFQALFNLGLVAAHAGDRATARQALRSFVERAPRDKYGADIAQARQALAQLGG